MSNALVVYSWPRLWSLGDGRGSPDFYHSLLALTRACERVTVVHPLEPDSRFAAQAPPGIEAAGFTYRQAPLASTPRGPRPLRALAFGINWPLRLLNYRWFNDAAYRAAQSANDGRRIDLVTAHGAAAAAAAERIAQKLGVPLVVRLFGVSLGFKGFSLPVLAAQFEETLGFKARAVCWIITDDGSGGRDAAYRMGIPPEKVRMLRAAVSQEFTGRGDDAARAEYRRGLGLSPDALVVLRVCRLWVQQHVERMIEALPSATPDGAPVAAVVVGDGPERERLEKLARVLGKTVVFTGAVPNADLSAHYAASDIYAATADRTNLSQSVLEALAHGLPVLALDAGTTSELIRDGLTGRLVPPGDPGKLRRGLEELVADSALRERLALGARCIAGQEIPDVESRVAAEARIYTQLLNGRG
jgi:glycosyltransferase involved in cell wall biosynthesis